MTTTAPAPPREIRLIAEPARRWLAEAGLVMGEGVAGIVLVPVSTSAATLTPVHLLNLQLAADGYSNAEIAKERGLAPDTIKTQMQWLYQHLRQRGLIAAEIGQGSRAEAVLVGLREGWLR